MADTKFGEIAVYEDDDGKAVWEFEGKVQSDIPLDTEAQDFAGAINELKKLSEEGGGEEWQPPDDWLEVPEPGEWEANFLIEVRDSMEFALSFSGFNEEIPGVYGDDMSMHFGTVTVDWGDGTVDTYEGPASYEESLRPEGGYFWRDEYCTHTYSEHGQYVVKATVDSCSRILYTVRDGKNNYTGKNLLITRLGEKICISKKKKNGDWYSLGSPFQSQYGLHWLEIRGDARITNNINYCESLKRVDFLKGLTEIGSNCFNARTAVPKSHDFSRVEKIGGNCFQNAVFENTDLRFEKCTEIGVYSFQNGNFHTLTAPICTSVGQRSFSACHPLHSVKFADGCTFGANCFQDCYSLYPRPDGSTN